MANKYVVRTNKENGCTSLCRNEKNRNSMSNHILISKKIKQLIIFLIIFPIIINSIYITRVYAGPQSTTYEIKEYDFGSGGISGDTSTTYSLFGNTGQVDGSSLTSTSYTNLPGLSYQITVNTAAVIIVRISE